MTYTAVWILISGIGGAAIVHIMHRKDVARWQELLKDASDLILKKKELTQWALRYEMLRSKNLSAYYSQYCVAKSNGAVDGAVLDIYLDKLIEEARKNG